MIKKTISRLCLFKASRPRTFVVRTFPVPVYRAPSDLQHHWDTCLVLVKTSFPDLLKLETWLVLVLVKTSFPDLLKLEPVLSLSRPPSRTC